MIERDKCWADSPVRGGGRSTALGPTLCASCRAARARHTTCFPTHFMQLIEPVAAQALFPAGSRVHVKGHGLATVVLCVSPGEGSYVNMMKVKFDSGFAYHVSTAIIQAAVPAAPFIAAVAFDGFREGYAFKLGAKGYGYYAYPSAAPAPLPAAISPASPLAPSSAPRVNPLHTPTSDAASSKAAPVGCPSPSPSGPAPTCNTPTSPSTPGFSIGASGTSDTVSKRRGGVRKEIDASPGTVQARRPAAALDMLGASPVPTFAGFGSASATPVKPIDLPVSPVPKFPGFGSTSAASPVPKFPGFGSASGASPVPKFPGFDSASATPVKPTFRSESKAATPRSLSAPAERLADPLRATVRVYVGAWDAGVGSEVVFGEKLILLVPSNPLPGVGRTPLQLKVSDIRSAVVDRVNGTMQLRAHLDVPGDALAGCFVPVSKAWQVRVPEGEAPGSVIGVVGPDGRPRGVEVPKDCGPGDSFSIDWPAHVSLNASDWMRHVVTLHFADAAVLADALAAVPALLGRPFLKALARPAALDEFVPTAPYGALHRDCAIRAQAAARGPAARAALRQLRAVLRLQCAWRRLVAVRVARAKHDKIWPLVEAARCQHAARTLCDLLLGPVRAAALTVQCRARQRSRSGGATRSLTRGAARGRRWPCRAARARVGRANSSLACSARG